MKEKHPRIINFTRETMIRDEGRFLDNFVPRFKGR